MNKYLNLIKNILVKKLLIIISVGIICAVALVAEKSLTTNYVTESGDVIVTKLVKVDHIDHSFYRPAETDYRSLLRTNYNLNSLFEALNGKIELSKFDANWPQMTKTEKVNTFRKNMTIYDYKNGNMELSLILNSGIPKDVEYIKDNVDTFFDEYVNQTNKTFSTMGLQERLSIVGTDYIYPEVLAFPKTKFYIKYGIIGFVLGTVVSGIMTLIYEYAKLNRKQNR